MTIEIEDVSVKQRDELFRLLGVWDFVNIREIPSHRPANFVPGDPSIDVTPLIGIWKDRDVTVESLREKAWKRKPWSL